MLQLLMRLIQLLAPKNDFITLKVDKLDIKNMVNVSTSLNNLTAKVDSLDDENCPDRLEKTK